MPTSSDTNEPPRYLNGPEAAAELRVHPETLYRMIERGDIPAVKLGHRWRIRRQDIDALLAGER